jgi:hypothetical protein
MTKKYLTTHSKEHKQQQHCPTCNRYKQFSSRYPDYVCEKCIKLATDKAGQGVGFYNITIDGHGCQGRYLETGKLYRGNSCFIKGIKCYADEAYMGGIVIRPIKFRKNKV